MITQRLILKPLWTLFSSSVVHQFGLLSPSHNASELIVNRDYLRELSYDVEQLSKLVYHNIKKLNPEQSHVYHEVIRSVDSDSGRVFSWMLLVEQEKRF